MPKSRIAELIEGAGSKPYRALVEHHVRRQSEHQLRTASLGEIDQLPEDLRPRVMTFIDVVNERVGYDREFWATANCREAYDRFVELAAEVFRGHTFVGVPGDPLWLEDEELAFQLFQIPTLSFAYSASSQRAQRRFMGIRKSILG